MPSKATKKKPAENVTVGAKLAADAPAEVEAKPKDTVVSQAQVNELLRDSMAMHVKAQSPGVRMPRPADWLVSLREAARLRREAIGLDPERVSGGWSAEQFKTPAGKDTHVMLMEFYEVIGL